MSTHLVDPLAMFAKRVAEEKFKLGDIKGAIFGAKLVKTLDPNVDGIDETLVAYRIHHAARIRTVNGATDWYRVLGIEEGYEDMEIIRKECNKLIAMLNPTKKASVATWGAHRIVHKAWCNLCDPHKRNVAILNQHARGGKVRKRACPRCGKWCNYEVPKVSRSAPKHGKRRISETILLVTCTSCRCKFDPISC